MSLRFQWDRAKAASNGRKHGDTFDEACTVFDDELARIFDDEDHSTEEAREIIIGHSTVGRLLVVSFSGFSNDVVRIISARAATRRERRDYEESVQP